MVDEKKEVEAEVKKPRMSKEKEALLKTVQNLGISTDGLSDQELLKKVVDELNKSSDKLAEKMAISEVDFIKKYVSGVEHNIKNQELLSRLRMMSVPSFYLHLFRDEDMILEDSELWSIINESGINPYGNVQDLFRKNKTFMGKGSKKRKRG